MKMSTNLFNSIKECIEALDTPEMREIYLRGDFPRSDKVEDLNKRYRWDLFFCWFRKTGENRLMLDVEELNNDDIDTALKKIVPPIKNPQTRVLFGVRKFHLHKE
jgi:hypothetical protein